MVIELQLRLGVPSFQFLQSIRHIKIAIRLRIGNLLLQFPLLLGRGVLLNGLLLFFLNQHRNFPFKCLNFIYIILRQILLSTFDSGHLSHPTKHSLRVCDLHFCHNLTQLLIPLFNLFGQSFIFLPPFPV
jgi:hypothetical protein